MINEIKKDLLERLFLLNESTSAFDETKPHLINIEELEKRKKKLVFGMYIISFLCALLLILLLLTNFFHVTFLTNYFGVYTNKISLLFLFGFGKFWSNGRKIDLLKEQLFIVNLLSKIEKN